MENGKRTVATCPFCGGRVVKTTKGYRCENNIGDQPKCSLSINGVIGNRKMADNEISELLANRRIMLDGFATKEWKTFPTVLILADDGSIMMDSKITKCPHCGGDIRVGTKAFNCSNYKQEGNPCNFVIWRNMGGHLLTEKDVREICEKGMTEGTVEMYREDGSIINKHLGLSPDKLQVIKI